MIFAKFALDLDEVSTSIRLSPLKDKMTKCIGGKEGSKRHLRGKEGRDEENLRGAGREEKVQEKSRLFKKKSTFIDMHLRA